jgi:hypothetical protein
MPLDPAAATEQAVIMATAKIPIPLAKKFTFDITHATV